VDLDLDLGVDLGVDLCLGLGGTAEGNERTTGRCRHMTTYWVSFHPA